MTTKHFLTGATLLSGLLLLNAPLFAAVESDIVGYTQIEMQAGKWYQIGNPFVGLDGSLEQALNQVFTSGFALGDTLLVFNPETGIYEQQLYWVPGNEGSGTWCSLPIPGAPASDKTLVAGQAVYINKAGGSGTVTLAGSVKPVEVEFGSEAGNAWAQVVAVWPEEKALNEMKWSGLALGDTLLVFNPETKLYEQQLYWVSLTKLPVELGSYLLNKDFVFQGKRCNDEIEVVIGRVRTLVHGYRRTNPMGRFLHPGTIRQWNGVSDSDRFDRYV